MTNFSFRTIDRLEGKDISNLLREGKIEGIHFLERLITEYEEGHNRFNRPGELLCAAFLDECIIGVCGLNQDPYSQDAKIGRLRRLYVSPAYRRCHVGSQLVNQVVHEAQKYYQVLTLRTVNPLASLFYEKLGFSDRSHYPQSTHHLLLENKMHTVVYKLG